MLLKCELIVMNRLAPGIGERQCHSTLLLGKRKKNATEVEVFFMLHTMRNKSGTKYKIQQNILRVHNRFVGEGKCTLSMKNPPHDLAISKADVGALKKFLHVLRLTLKGEDTTNIEELNNVLQLKNCDIEKPKTKLTVYQKTDYPMKTGFPVTLETLTINDCCLKRFDGRISKLRNLSILDLSRNMLRDMCESLDSLENLRCLYLSQNAFEAFPLCVTRGKTAGRLKNLDLSSNQIKYVPANISSLRTLHTLKLNDNCLVSLPHTFGDLKEIKRLELNGNLLSCLPWSFSRLTLDFLDVSENSFNEMKTGILDVPYVLSHPPSLFETCCRAVVQYRIRSNEHTKLPRTIKETLAVTKYCPCGAPCFREGVPFITDFDAAKISHTLSYNCIQQGSKQILKLMSSLCSMRCFRSYSRDPSGFERRGLRRGRFNNLI